MDFLYGLGRMMQDTALTTAVFKIPVFIIAVIGMLNVFFGYRVLRISVGLNCFFAAIFLFVFIIAVVLEIESSAVLWLVIIVFAILAFMLGYMYHRGIFVILAVINTFLTILMLSMGASYLSSNEITASGVIVGIILGILLATVVGILVKKFYHHVVIISSGLMGASILTKFSIYLFAYKGLYDFIGSVVAKYASNLMGMFMQSGSSSDDGKGWIVIAIIIAVIGIYFQYKTYNRKISSFFSQLGTGRSTSRYAPRDDQGQSGEGQAGTTRRAQNSRRADVQRRVISNVKNSDNDVVKSAVGFFDDIQIQQIKNFNIYIIVPIVLLILYLFGYIETVHIVLTVLLIIICVAMLLIYNRIISNSLVFSIPATILVLLLAIMTIVELVTEGSIYLLLMYVSSEIFIVSAWSSFVGKKIKEEYYLWSGGLALLCFLLFALKGEFQFYLISISILSIPFCLKTIMQYMVEKLTTKDVI